MIAARDRTIQQSIMTNTGRDGAKMKFMAILTAFFLPGTFMAVWTEGLSWQVTALTLLQVFLTTPMFNFLDDTKPLLTKGGAPLGIYWGVTGLLCVLFLIGVYILHKPIVVCRLLDHLICVKRLRTYAQNGGFYKACEQRSTDIEEKKRTEDGATEHKEMAKNNKNGPDAEG
jgi:hypothetical protein